MTFFLLEIRKEKPSLNRKNPDIGLSNNDDTIDTLLRDQFDVKHMKPTISPAPAHSHRSVTSVTQGIGKEGSFYSLLIEGIVKVILGKVPHI